MSKAIIEFVARRGPTLDSEVRSLYMVKQPLKRGPALLVPRAVNGFDRQAHALLLREAKALEGFQDAV